MTENQKKGVEERSKNLVVQSDRLREKQEEIIKRLAELSERINRVRAKHRPVSDCNSTTPHF
jgi:hypothetical protein